MSAKPTLYLICVLTDFAGFVVVFAVSRGLAEMQAEAWYLGVVGAGLSVSAGVGSLLGGWLAHRIDGRVIFVTGTITIGLSIAACGLGDLQSYWFLSGYWLLGIGLGFLYPPLIGWLNQGEDAHANRRGVSRTLILFCVAWNLGMMGGQLAAGELFALGTNWTYGTAFAVALVNAFVAVAAARQIVPLSAPPDDRMEVAPISQSVRAEPEAVDLATAFKRMRMTEGARGWRTAFRSVPPQPEAVELATAFKRLSWIANLGGMFGGSMVLHLLPKLAVEIGVPADAHGMLLACWRAVIIATYLLMHYAAFWHYRLGTSLAAQALAAFGLVVIALADSADTLLIGLALLGQLVGYNYFSGLFYSTAGSAHDRRALGAGIHEATLAAGMAVGTIVGGVVSTLWNLRLPYLLAAVVIVVLMAVQSAAWRIWVLPLRRRWPKVGAEPSALN